MNGHLTPFLLSVIAGLLGMVNLLFGLVLKAHKDVDDERWKGMTEEIAKLRARVHDMAGRVGKVDQWQRFHDDEDTK